MLLSILIVNWNTGNLLFKCLESIYNEIPNGVEVIVVDNASTDNSANIAQDIFKRSIFLYLEENIGFGAANNLAIKRSRGRYLLFLNPDTIVMPGALQKLIEFMEVNNNAGAAGAKLLNPDKTLQHSCSQEPTYRSEFMRLLHIGNVRPDGYYSMEDWNQNIPRLVDTVLGACMIVRRTVLDQIGLFDENFFMYSEEVDLCRRVREAGWPIYWAPEARVIHYGGQSTRQVASEMFLQLYKGKVNYFRKYHGNRGVVIYKFILYFVGMVRVLLAPIKWLINSSHRDQQRIIFKNYRRLLIALPGM